MMKLPGNKKDVDQPVIGFAWYRREEWDRLRQISEDVEILEDTYDQWLVAATKKLKEMQMMGFTVEKVDVSVGNLLAYCALKGVSINGESRSQYVMETLRLRRLGEE